MDYSGLILVALLTLLPGLELRLSIPVGILSGTLILPLGFSISGLGLPILPVLLVAVTTNIILGPIVYLSLKHLIDFFTKIKLINQIYQKFVVRTQKKVFPLVEKYGLIGIALFVAVPLPGSGSWTGALAAYLLGMRKRDFFKANALGVIIAGILVSAATIGILSLPI